MSESTLLHRESALFLQLASQPGRKQFWEVPLDTARAGFLRNIELLNRRVDRPLRGNESETNISGLPGTPDIPVTIYKPENAGENPPIVIFFHGGGFVLGCRKSHEVCCRKLAELCGAVFINVEYRLGPEHRIPAGHDDAIAAARWVLQNKSSLGGPQSVVGVCGDSAGGNLAACTAHDVNNLDFQILIYPVTNMMGHTESREQFGGEFHLTTDTMKWFGRNSMDKKTDLFDARWNVLNRSSFRSLPPALIITGQVDPLADDCIDYHRKLSNAGTRSDLLILAGVIHGFTTIPGLFKESCGLAYSRIQTFLNDLTKEKVMKPKL